MIIPTYLPVRPKEKQTKEDPPAKQQDLSPLKANKKKTQVITSEIDDQVQENSGAANKEKGQAVTSEIDDQVQENSGAPEDVKKNSGSCSGNYIMAEFVQICNSLLKTMEDPLNSTNQSGTTFWDQVRRHYIEHLPQYPRSADSVKSCFGLIQRLTSKFHGCVKQIILANQSGKTLTD
ncbi:hypothetical protein MJO28_000974 [Puccinia striiformis f. sp. tritici]|uniref:Uncharacterized protein n=1 Tax=Puccinia striiformis f. sp. tritici TaxID=168172 RepID=A0ACC0EYZ5_9BASI|nr:hypothetical protein MJO28_000974 [Puccinia striiformis f. sp. tritici]